MHCIDDLDPFQVDYLGFDDPIYFISDTSVGSQEIPPQSVNKKNSQPVNDEPKYPQVLKKPQSYSINDSRCFNTADLSIIELCTKPDPNVKEPIVE
ncbi:hypothetical protein G9A89_002133 [Geosiphon pyriformis]|nr:hypothetical protein G9A89_002133 [Geosiphon pyriformis]